LRNGKWNSFEDDDPARASAVAQSSQGWILGGKLSRSVDPLVNHLPLTAMQIDLAIE
jgi:hypothetical protein